MATVTLGGEPISVGGNFRVSAIPHIPSCWSTRT
jgi:hypothetical protein